MQNGNPGIICDICDMKMLSMLFVLPLACTGWMVPQSSPFFETLFGAEPPRQRMKIHDSYDRLSEDTIRSLESRVSERLPSEYRTFLLTNNGGKPEPLMAFRQRDGELCCVQEFFGVHSLDGNSSDIIWNLDCFRGRIPSSLLPIACTPVGDIVCLGFAKEHRGKVYLWDHENEGEEGNPTFDNITTLTDTFDRFLQGFVIDRFFARHVEHKPLFRAIEEWRLDEVRNASADHATLRERGEEDKTLLMCAMNNRYLEAADFLIRIGADAADVDGKGRTAVHYAVFGHSFDGIKRLKQARADIDAADNEGATPLIVAIRVGSWRIARWLVSQGVDVNTTTRSGETPLRACGSRHSAAELRKLLLEAGATE